jgi:hypothetical protein
MLKKKCQKTQNNNNKKLLAYEILVTLQVQIIGNNRWLIHRVVNRNFDDNIINVK